MKKWNLDKLYPSYESESFQNDLKKFDEIIKKINDFSSNFMNQDDAKNKLETYLEYSIEMRLLYLRLFWFVRLNQSTNTTDGETLKYLTRLQMKLTELTESGTLYQKWLSNLENSNEIINSSEFLKEHKFVLNEIIEESKYLLDEKTELLLSKLNQTGRDAWGRLHGLLTSTLAVDYNDEEITLSEVRNLAYDKSPVVRKKAYHAELKAYEKIDKSIAQALNSMKGEVNIITEFRGYESGLDEALKNSRIKRETLDAMLEAMKEYLPYFREYLKRKAKLLNHENGLPFYDLFAPIGSSAKEFTIKEAQEYILKNFKTFGPHLHNLAKDAFDNDWIDYTPRKGKSGGAFCANIIPIKESRVLSNFTGSFSDVITLAHELGHAYHGDCIFEESVLNGVYTMPVAETASTFCETIVMKSALKDANEEEQVFLLESSLQDSTQVIVDILSRFIFEKNVFDGRKNNVFNEGKLKELMIDAQKQTYGDGLDENYLHPYMWVNKVHYYRNDINYYNYPYAFGLLFAKGLYAQYQKEGTSFVQKYDNLLRSTGKMNVEEVSQLIGIDVTKKEFWINSLNIIKEDIDTFLNLTK